MKNEDTLKRLQDEIEVPGYEISAEQFNLMTDHLLSLIQQQTGEEIVVPSKEITPRWQPVVMIVNRRLECQCGAIAVFVSGKVSETNYNVLDDVDCWCQNCYELEQEKSE